MFVIHCGPLKLHEADLTQGQCPLCGGDSSVEGPHLALMEESKVC